MKESIKTEHPIVQQSAYTICVGENLRIAISGLSGCGNTTVSTLLAEKIGIPCINYTFRSLAEEMHIPLKEVMQRAKGDFTFDRLVDQKQLEQAQLTSCVLGSRLAIWVLKEAQLKVYLAASSLVRAQRIYQREGGDLAAIQQFTAMRDADDTRRYKQLYGIDNTDYAFVDLCIDTEQHQPEAIVALIIEELIKRHLIAKTK